MDLVDFVLERQIASGSEGSDAQDSQRENPDGGEVSGGVLQKIRAGQPPNPEVISKSTFRQLKASLLFVFREQLQSAETRLDAEYIEEAIERLESTAQTGFLKRGRMTSSLKAKKVSEADFKTLLAAIDEKIADKSAYWANALRIFLRANRIAGLRPSEWAEASIKMVGPDGATPVLVVKNAKTTGGRGNGPIRVLELEGLPPDDLDAIHEMVQLVDAVESREISGIRATGRGRKAQLSGYGHLLKHLGPLLHRITREVFPPNSRRKTWPTLYTLRHQVAADAKRTGTQAEVAALLGHASDATAGQHYGRRISGTRKVGIKATSANVKTVRARAKSYRPSPNR